MKISRTIELTQKQEKVGRNDPCSCGSGKKYKKCHLNSEPVVFSDKYGWISRLMDWATVQPWYFPVFQKTFKQVFGDDKREVNEEEMKSLSETILFEIKAKANKTPLKLFVEEAHLSSEERSIYQSWLNKGMFGTWEVLEVFLGKGCSVRRFAGADEHLVSEHLGSYSIQPGDVIVSRLLPFAAGWMFGGGVMAKIPEPWVYEFKKHQVNFQISGLEFIKLWFGKQEKNVIDIKTYEELKNELVEFVTSHELPFDLENFDEVFQKASHPTVFFYPLYKSLYGFPELMDQASQIVLNLWNKSHVKEDITQQIGPIETALVHDFSEYCGKRFQKEEILDPQTQLELSRNWQTRWLGTFQKTLGATPKKAIEKERQEFNNLRTTFDYESTVVFWPKRWEEASRLHEKGLKAFQKNDFNQANQFFRRVVNDYQEFPHIYRTLANLAMTEAAVGNKKEAVMLLQKALEINPRYSFAKGRLQAIGKESGKSLRQKAEIIQLKGSFNKLVEMVTKAQSKKKKRRRRYWLPKGRGANYTKKNS